MLETKFAAGFKADRKLILKVMITKSLVTIQLLRTGWYLLPNKPIQNGTRIVLTYEDGWIRFLEPIPWMTIYLVRNPTT